jgi:hypothetical protein
LAERRIGLIPNAVTMIRSGNNETCGILVTDRRTIFAFETPKVKGAKAGLRDTFGLEPGGEATKPPALDPGTADIDSMARIDGNIVVPHISIKKFEFAKFLGGYVLTISYESEQGKEMGVMATLLPPKQLLKAKKLQGLSPKDIKKQYAEKAAEVFKRALPPVAAAKGVWKL